MTEHQWKIGDKVSKPPRYSGPWSDLRMVTKVTAAGNVALDFDTVQFRIDRNGEAIVRKGDTGFSTDRYYLMTPERLAEREAGNAAWKHTRRARATALALSRLADSDPASIPTDLLAAIEAVAKP